MNDNDDYQKFLDSLAEILGDLVFEEIDETEPWIGIFIVEEREEMNAFWGFKAEIQLDPPKEESESVPFPKLDGKVSALTFIVGLYEGPEEEDEYEKDFQLIYETEVEGKDIYSFKEIGEKEEAMVVKPTLETEKAVILEALQKTKKIFERINEKTIEKGQQLVKEVDKELISINEKREALTTKKTELEEKKIEIWRNYLNE